MVMGVILTPFKNATGYLLKQQDRVKVKTHYDYYLNKVIDWIII